MQKKVQRLTYNIARQSHAIIAKYQMNAVLCDVIFRGWTPLIEKPFAQPGYSAVYSFDHGAQIAVLNFGEDLGSMKQRRHHILNCLSSKDCEIKPRKGEIN